MTNELTPILEYRTYDLAWIPPQQEQAIGIPPTWDTIAVGTEEAAVRPLAAAFDAWAEADAATPIDPYLCQFHDEICRRMAFKLPPRLFQRFPAGVATRNPAADLRRWLSPEIAIPSLAAACGVSERGFYDWLRGGGIRERNARRLLHVRGIVQALTLRLDREGTIEWLLTPKPALQLATPLDALAAGEQDRVTRLVASSLAQRRPRRSGPMIAEDTAEDFSSFELTTAQPGTRRRRRRSQA